MGTGAVGEDEKTKGGETIRPQAHTTTCDGGSTSNANACVGTENKSRRVVFEHFRGGDPGGRAEPREQTREHLRKPRFEHPTECGEINYRC